MFNFTPPAHFGQVSDHNTFDGCMGMMPNYFGMAEAAFIEDQTIYMLNLELSDPFQFAEAEESLTFCAAVRAEALAGGDMPIPHPY